MRVMPASKIQDESEIIRWFEQGKTYQWMSDEYMRKYGLDVHMTMFSNFRRRRGLDGRKVRDTELIPWKVKAEHRFASAVTHLRQEARRRAGVPLTPDVEQRLNVWIANLKEDGLVVHYDPELEFGFVYVPAREGIDNDLIREPDRRRTGGTVKKHEVTA
jgi:hypothetical protein